MNNSKFQFADVLIVTEPLFRHFGFSDQRMQTLNDQREAWLNYLNMCGDVELAMYYATQFTIGGRCKNARTVLPDFIDYVEKNPELRGQFLNERIAPAGTCQACAGNGYFDAPTVNLKNGEEHTRSFACTCGARLRVAGWPDHMQADSIMYAWRVQEHREETRRARQWLIERGFAANVTFAEFWREVKSRGGLGKKVETNLQN